MSPNIPHDPNITVYTCGHTVYDLSVNATAADHGGHEIEFCCSRTCCSEAINDMNNMLQKLIEALEYFHVPKQDCISSHAAEVVKKELERHRRECGFVQKGKDEELEDQEDDNNECEWRCRQAGAVLLDPVSSDHDLGTL